MIARSHDVICARGDELDPFALADFLAIPVVSFDACGDAMDLGRSARMALVVLRDRVYALTACAGRRRVIICNDRNARTRQVSDIAHDLSHTLLEHEPTPLEHPERYFERDVELEEEANILAGALLVPREGALVLARDGRSDEDLATHYGVSVAMARWRSRITGVRLQVRRGRNGRRGLRYRSSDRLPPRLRCPRASPPLGASTAR